MLGHDRPGRARVVEVDVREEEVPDVAKLRPALPQSFLQARQRRRGTAVEEQRAAGGVEQVDADCPLGAAEPEVNRKQRSHNAIFAMRGLALAPLRTAGAILTLLILLPGTAAPLARHPDLLAGAAAFDAATDMARRYWDFAGLPDGRLLQLWARQEIGGTPLTVPAAYAERSPDTYVRQIALSDVPLELYSSIRDRVIADQNDETGLLVDQIRGWNPFADTLSFRGTWAHTREMWPRGRLPDALARLGLLPWSLVPKTYVPTWARGRTSAASRSATKSLAASIPTDSRTRLRGGANGASAVDASVIRAGDSIRLSTPPSDSARQKSLVRAQMATASSSDSARKETMPPKSRIW